MTSRWIIGLTVLVTLASCKKLFFKPEPANDPEALFEYLWATYHDGYGPTAQRGIDWDSLYAAYRPQVTAATSDDELFTIITDMLATLNDGHVHVIAPDHVGFSSNQVYRERIDDSLFDIHLVTDHYLDPGFVEMEDHGYTYGTVGDVIYIHLPWVADNMPILPIVLDEHGGLTNLIIDLRHNGGGDFTWAFEAFGQLTSEERPVFQSRTKNGTGPDDFTDWYDWSLIPQEPFRDMKIVVLTDRYTISAGERAVMALKVLPGCVHIGDTTNGAHATMIGREMANGWYFTLPIQETLFADGKTYEGIGMIPDTVVRNNLTDMGNGIDGVLEEGLRRF